MRSPSAVELGPYGYLPTNADRLVNELDSRGLQLAGGWIDGPLERAGVWQDVKKQLDAVAQLVVDAGGSYLGVVASMYSDARTGELVSVRTLSDEQWSQYAGLANRIGEGARSYGLGRMLFHQHADSPVEFEDQIERFLELTDPELVGMLHDVGHHAYRGGDPVQFYRDHHDRIDAVHIKSVDEAIARRVKEERIPWGEAVELGVFAAPYAGAVDFTDLKSAMDEVGYGGWSVVEQDMYPAPPDKPLPIATSTFKFLTEIGYE